MLRVNIGKFGDIITSRPKGMDYEEYRAKRKEMCLKLRGYNVTIMEGAAPIKKHVMGRLEGILIPSAKWTNSKDVQVVIA